ncbi:MAG: transglutaminase-like domain-containing protein [Alphaproteobacteria bacterium]|nr:transglutaminase-like domain-containing protein [Alphaproteobacteria bacterium]
MQLEHDQALRILMSAGEAGDEQLDIGETALALAALEDGSSPLTPYRAFMDMVVRDIQRKSGAFTDMGNPPPKLTLDDQILLLRNTLVLNYGFTGDRDSYNSLENANLMRVIDRRKGLPVALGILYLHIARKLGWNMVGLSFPGHFLLRLETEGERAILDPFDNCVVRHTIDLRELLKSTQGTEAELLPEHYEAVSDRQVLLRLQNNIKMRRLQHGELEKAIDCLQTMVLFAPAEAMLWRELGLFHGKAGNIKSAVSALETFMKLGVPESLKHQTALILQKLRSGLQ